MTGSNSDASDDRMTRVSARVTEPMLAAIDRLVEAGEYSSRGECIRAGIRREFRDAGVERGDRRPGRGGDRLIGDGGQPRNDGSDAAVARWQRKAAENRAEWGEQSVETLLLAAQEELGELTQAHLEYCHEDGEYSMFDELDDLGALLVQLHWALSAHDIEFKDGGSA